MTSTVKPGPTSPWSAGVLAWAAGARRAAATTNRRTVFILGLRPPRHAGLRPERRGAPRDAPPDELPSRVLPESSNQNEVAMSPTGIILNRTLSDLEAALHDRRVRIAHVPVGALLQRHRPGRRALCRDTGVLVHA